MLEQKRYNNSTLNDLDRYILYIYRDKRWKIKLTKVQHQILWIFCEKEIAHSYECGKYLFSRYKKKIAQNNVRKQVLKLCDLGLIKRKKLQENTKHNADYYTLSSFGIFYVIKNSNLISVDLNFIISIKTLIANHPYNDIFKLFLYPIINHQTMKKIDNNKILTNLKDFLESCSNSIVKILNQLLEIEKNGGVYYFVSSFPSILDPIVKEDDYGTLPDFIRYLQDRFKMNRLDKNKSKIEKITNNEILLKITFNNLVLYLKLDEKKNKALLYKLSNNQKKIIFNFDLEKYEEIYIISEFIPQTIDQKINSYGKIIEKEFLQTHLPVLIFKLLQDNFNTFNLQLSRKEEDEQNYILLANDSKFMKHIEKIKNDFDLQHDLFCSMIHSVISSPSTERI